MAKRFATLSKRAKRAIPKLEMIPVQDSPGQDPLRLKDLDDLIAQIVLLGRRKERRGVSRDKEQNNAA